MGSFNARRKATNFTDEAFEQACRAAHLAGSRVYVTVNIVIKQSEMGDALQLIHRCSTLGADAFIIQDWGLFFEVKRTMPGIETHISTQANIHDDRGTLWCREQGADRVTLSRELSIDEIAAIHDAAPDVDLEVFSHGAICFCYSGLCLLSSFAMAGRSANRGMCAQPCRLPYELIDENGRSLSPAGRERALCPRDTNTSQLVRRLYDAGASSLKLEGRMKAPDYVYSIVDVYRHEIDDMLSGVAVAKDKEAARQRQLKRCFNRDFTHAYQDGTSGDEMMSYERSNNRGQIVGTVLDSRPANRDVRGLKPDDRRRRAAIARIELFEPVGKGDLLELRHDNEFDQFLTTIAADDAAAGDIIECRVPRSMPEGCRVRVIRSQRAIDAAGRRQKTAVQGQLSLFDAVEDVEIAPPPLPDLPEFSRQDQLRMEREVTGVYITGHPLDEYEAELSKLEVNSQVLQGLSEEADGGMAWDQKLVSMGGIVAERKLKATKSGTMMAFVQLEDMYGLTEVLVFPKVYDRVGHLLNQDAAVLLTGRLSVREEESPKLLLDSVRPLGGGEAAPAPAPRAKEAVHKLYIKCPDALREEALAILRQTPGNIPVILVSAETGRAQRAPQKYWVDEGYDFFRLANLLGEKNVVYK